MPIQTRNKTTVPVNSDPYALTADIKTAIEGLNAPIPVADEAERDGLPLPFEGMQVVRLDAEGMIETYLGGDWQPTAVDISTFGTGITPLTGNHKPRLWRTGPIVHMFGAVQIVTGGSLSNLCTPPANWVPASGATMFIGTAVTNNGDGFELTISNGVVAVPSGYNIGSIELNSVLPLRSSWFLLP